MTNRFRDVRWLNSFSRFARSFVVAIVANVVATGAFAADEVEPAVRKPWTASRVTGSPDPPPPLKVVNRFPRLKFDHPLLIARDPASQRLWIAEQAGRIHSFTDDDSVETPDLFVDLKESYEKLVPHAGAGGIGAVYGMTFHPEFPRVPVCWIAYTLTPKPGGSNLDDGTRLSRFHVTFDASGVPRCDPSSERVVLTWLEGGHNGACLEFGPDGCLYVSTGDGAGPNPPDPKYAGQDVSNLLSTICRIEVMTDGDSPLYRVPEDNPFVKLDGARPEIWAYGFRNPWKMTFAPNGELWVGDVGWEMYEMVYRIQRGGNYGWSIMEGPQTVRPEAKRGPTEILPPAIALAHTDAASVTGGYVYRGSRFPELRGTYIFGDFETRRVWSSKFDGEKLVSLTDLVRPSVRLVAFAEDARGELLLLDYEAGTIHALERNDASTTTASFPMKLSETGLFDNLTSLDPSEGVVPFAINAEMWLDGAAASRFLAVPGADRIDVATSPTRRNSWMWREAMFFPKDSVLAKNVTLKDDSGRDVRLETQVLHYDGIDWRPYSYVWNTDQTDAMLSPAAGQQLDLKSYGRFPERSKWLVHSRSECLRCHNQWLGGPLAFTQQQLNRRVAEADSDWNQLTWLRDTGWLKGAVPAKPDEVAAGEFVPLVSPHDETSSLDLRARSWLDVNCSHCHQMHAGGTAIIDLRRSVTVESMGLLNAGPSQGNFQLDQPALVVPGDPARSVLMYRVAMAGRGRMPHIGSSIVDPLGVKLVQDWITALPADPANSAATLSSAAAAPTAITSTTEALRWVGRIHSGNASPSVRDAVLRIARESPPEISGLFERFQPAELRRSVRVRIDASGVLALQGDASLGEKLFADKRMQCVNCHQMNSKGGSVGPALDDVGKRLNREQILQSLLEPSAKVDPKYTTWVVETKEGKVASGLLIERTDAAVLIRTSKPEDFRIARSDIEDMTPQAASLMPDRLLNDLTDEEIASLARYLGDQRR